ncbi:MAG: tRNA (guanosine(37)-N1)-methyltransferase TrmD [Candidatus Sungbacteria bacterium]|nr:tRNA (guanosine(37)-N1)-methyltransferase TrmD [Candidatus Sungbacteria bacterium]
MSFLNPRDFTRDKHRITDDKAYGGGPGMVMKAEPILKAVFAALRRIKNKESRIKRTKILLLSPRGEQFTQEHALELSKYDTIILIAGHYEGIDARVLSVIHDSRFMIQEISVGPYVLSGGELPAMVVVDAVTRQIPGVLGKSESLEESRAASPEVYTRPESFTYKKKTYRVPEVLRSGDHKKIEEWRKSRTQNQRKNC